MKTLVLKNGISLQFTDNSSITNLIAVVSNFTGVDDLRNVMTEDNLSQCNFDGIEYTDVVIDTVSTISKGYGNVQVTFFTKTTSDSEIEALKQQVAELQEVNANLSDKAEAADILMGNEEV